MCGIMGYVGGQDAWDIVMGGLRRLEYRGYDSAGVVTLHDGKLHRARSVGHLRALEQYGPTPLHRLSFEPVRSRSLFPVDYDGQMELFAMEASACR